MEEFPPSLDPKLYTLLSLIIGYALIGDFSANEQRAIGNWLIGIGQVLMTNSTFQIMIEDRITGPFININSKQFKCGGSPFTKEPRFNFDNSEQFNFNFNSKLDIDFLMSAIEKINIELEKIRKDM